MAEWSMAVVLKTAMLKRTGHAVWISQGLKSSQTAAERNSAAILP
jgi:hypothetical protein